MKKFLALITAAILTTVAVTSTTAQISSPSPEASVVKVIVGSGHGSGVVLKDGFILTANHVTENEPNIQVFTKGSAIEKATLFKSNKDLDLSLIQMDKKTWPASSVKCSALTIGEKIEAIGNPQGMEFHHFWGKVAGEQTVDQRWLALQAVDMAGGAGMSGGPVFSPEGNVRGIVVAGFGSVSPIMFVVPAPAVCEFLGE